MLLIGGGYAFREPIKLFLDFFIDAVDEWGYLGYLAYAAVYTALEVLAVPAIPLTMTAGVIFGPIPGTMIVSFSATLAATIAFLIARYAARDRVSEVWEKVLGSYHLQPYALRGCQRPTFMALLIFLYLWLQAGTFCFVFVAVTSCFDHVSSPINPCPIPLGTLSLLQCVLEYQSINSCMHGSPSLSVCLLVTTHEFKSLRQTLYW